MPLPTYAPPPGVAYFTLTANICGLDQDAVAGGLADDAAPLGVALRKFSACAAAAVQPAVNTTVTFLAATLAATHGKAAKARVALPRGAVTAAAADCAAWLARAARVSARRLRQLQSSTAAAAVCTELFARVTSRAPAAAALASLLAAPASPGAYASALAVLLEPVAAVNTAATQLAAFFGALMAGKASAVPALSSLLILLSAELAVVPAPAAAAASLRRSLTTAANESGATFAVLAVSDVELVPEDVGLTPAPPPEGGSANGALIGGVVGGIVLILIVATVAPVVLARRQRARRAAARAAALAKARSAHRIASARETPVAYQNPLQPPAAGASSRAYRLALGAPGGGDGGEAHFRVFQLTPLRRVARLTPMPGVLPPPAAALLPTQALSAGAQSAGARTANIAATVTRTRLTSRAGALPGSARPDDVAPAIVRWRSGGVRAANTHAAAPAGASSAAGNAPHRYVTSSPPTDLARIAAAAAPPASTPTPPPAAAVANPVAVAASGFFV